MRAGALKRRFWSLHAPSFERVRSETDAQAATERVADLMAEHLPPNGDVIDLGCGPGFHSLALAHRGFDVVGVDYADGMLSRARRRTTGTTVRFRQADLNRALPFPDRTFDGAICVAVVQVLESPGRTLQEARKRGAPGAPGDGHGMQAGDLMAMGLRRRHGPVQLSHSVRACAEGRPRTPVRPDRHAAA